jgi:hypothetical protein
MKSRGKWFFAGIAVMVILLFALSAPGLATQKIRLGVMTITGTVVEHGKDKEGKVASVAIQTEEQGNFEVTQRRKGTSVELTKLINKKVEVTGTVVEEDGKKIITATFYKLLGEK